MLALHGGGTLHLYLFLNNTNISDVLYLISTSNFKYTDKGYCDMWDAIGNTAKIFLEKHFIPTVIAIVGAIALFLFLPEDFWMIEKLGKWLFLLFAAGGIFLVVQFLLVLFNGFQRINNSAYIRQENARIAAEEEAKNVEKCLSFVDKLSPEDRDLILRFIETGNQPITVHGYITKYRDCIYNTNVVVSTENRDCSRQYKLDERFYKTMKAIYDERGSISHF